MRLIDADALIQEAERLYEEWNKAMAGAEGAKQINKVYKMQELSKAVAEVARNMTTYAPHSYELRWIPCSERLPEMHEENDCGVKIKVSEPVLFCEKTGLHACVHIGTCREALEERWWLTREWKTYKDVAAWMPLPEACKED